MRVTKNSGLRAAFALILLFSLLPASAHAQDKQRGAKQDRGTPVLWRDPGDVSSRNLYHGPGSPDMAPAPPFTFLEEVKGGESPKFKVRDARGVEWSVKLGPEAQSETVSTRLVWAVGYFAEEAYYFDQVRVERLPRLSRGREYVSANTVRNARFEPRRENVKEGPEWSWRDSPFEDSREMDGLKVLMILLNNYDARKGNNHILYVDMPAGREARYVVTDLGATLGRAGGLGGKRAKNDLEAFLSTKFVRGVDERDQVVEFDFDTRPRGFGHLAVLQPFYYRGEVKKEAAMRGIPVAHAAWIGSYLSRLTDAQLYDAFRAAHYEQVTADGYVRALRERINQLSTLRGGQAAAVGEPVASAGTVVPSRTAIAEEYRGLVDNFERQVREYVALREELEDRMPKLSKEATAEEIEAHKLKFQEVVRTARVGARQGDVFTPEAMTFIRAAILDEFKGRDRLELRQAVAEAENKAVPIRVNAAYPDAQEILEMPPTLLLRLPQLPKQVRYRFVGSYLLLVDRENRLIIDFMPDAIP
jgi:hypothetical protein